MNNSNNGILSWILSTKIGKTLLIGSILLIVVLIVNPFVLIPEGSRGLKFTLGKIDNKFLTPGISFKIPVMQSIEKVPVTPLVFEKTIQVNNDGAITKDNQTIGSTIKVFYRYTEEGLIEMWSKYGTTRIVELVGAATTESFKVVIGSYDIFKLPMSQDKIRSEVLITIREKTKLYPVEITAVNILNFDWSDEFDAQIQSTMKRAQEVKQKEQELLIAEQEAQKDVKKAEAQKQALITIAQGEREAAKLNAEAKALEGEGIRKYNNSVQANMALEVQLRKLEIEKIKAEKWDGHYVSEKHYGPIPVDTKSGLLPKE